jgi:Bacterial regulatory proteins, luxR family/PQQ-like domain
MAKPPRTSTSDD